MKELTIHIMIDQNGDWVVCDPQETDVSEKYNETFDAIPECAQTYVVNLKVPLPAAKVLTATLPAPKSEPAELVIAEA